ncbi:tellurite resistance TerB family protein [Pseudoduganella aquatica]|uniref:TerB family tellurite resistance protein n=1 Tax=Pseudoduganella aquatica TaxID=2660641 RepID=A0A7X4HCS0_9BURK|nr:TerB family tellurite resistance protein [Pseudoduganella aquatica]MYN08212.1 TerB family tellurite resistance protein [Pseudoduganella aquatica]
MRHYQPNSASAAGRILALAMVVDGHMAPSELRALERSRLLEHIDIDMDSFHDLVQELCYDLLACNVKNDYVELDPGTTDLLLADITDSELRRELLRAMWNIADADGVLADGEAKLLARACVIWAAEARFITEPDLAE